MVIGAKFFQNFLNFQFISYFMKNKENIRTIWLSSRFFRTKKKRRKWPLFKEKSEKGKIEFCPTKHDSGVSEVNAPCSLLTNSYLCLS